MSKSLLHTLLVKLLMPMVVNLSIMMGLLSSLSRNIKIQKYHLHIDTIVCAVDSSFKLSTMVPHGLWTGKGMDLNSYFHPINANMGENWISL